MMTNTVEVPPMKIQRPKLPKQLESIKLQEADISDHAEFRQAQCSDEELSYITASKVMCDQMIFRNVSFRDVSLQHAELTDVIFEQCDLSNVDLTEAIIHRAQFHQCKIMGMDMTAATMRNIAFVECAGDYATFRFADMKQVSYQETSLEKSDFYHAKFNKVGFDNCKIDQSQFSGASLKGIDLSTADFHNLGVTLEDLQGCIISPSQAILFTKIFGLVVKD